MRVLCTILLSVFAIGCSVPRSVPEGGRISGQTVNPAGKVLILTITDGQEIGQPVATGSGKALSSAIRKVLSTHQIPLSTSDCTKLIDAYAEATAINFDYILKCDITLWEDNATAWSGNGDKLRISIELFDVKSKQLVAAASHYRVATGATLVASNPERFMDECSEGALNKIYDWANH